MDNQSLLLSIVKGWSINPEPEYRGFRCANCQNYINEAYYHFLNNESYKTPVHLCTECEKLFGENKIELKDNVVSQKEFKAYDSEIESKFEALISDWNINLRSLLKVFYCDNCGNDLDLADGKISGWHVWFKSNFISELHFCKDCKEKMIS